MTMVVAMNYQTNKKMKIKKKKKKTGKRCWEKNIQMKRDTVADKKI